MKENIKPATAELIGTFMLTFVGAGAAAIGTASLEGVALAHGLILVTIIFVYGHISGAHVNPAVTLGLLIGGKIDTGKAVFYWIAQFVGGALGGLAVGFFSADPGNYGQTLMSIDLLPGLLLEVLLTFFLVSAVYQAAVHGKAGNLAPFAIGLTLAAAILIGGPLTGASLNPARSFGPALAAGNLGAYWPYLVGPGVGGLLAGVVHNGYFND